MFSANRILLPVDFSESGRGAVGYAAALAARFGSEIIAVHVTEPVEGIFGLESGVVLEEISRNRAVHLNRQLESCLRGRLPDSQLRLVLLEGDPALEIVKLSQSEHVDLIVMATHGYGPFRRLLMGSVTAKVLHDAVCPVLTGVHMERALYEASPALRTIGCAIDLGPQSHAALCWAAGIARAEDARLVVLHAAFSIADAEAREQATRITRQAIAEEAAFLDTAPDVYIGYGKPAPVVCELAKEVSADLLVIGRGHGSAAGGRLPTDAYAIIRDSPCPVVSV